MNNTLRAIISLSLCSLLLGLMPPAAQAQIYKCVDANGKTAYSSERVSSKNCKQVTSGAVSTVHSNVSPASFPKISSETQRERDKARRTVLENELNNELAALAEARKKLSEQESIRNGDEKNYQRVLDRLQPFKDAVERRERNVETLNRELSGMR